MRPLCSAQGSFLVHYVSVGAVQAHVMLWHVRVKHRHPWVELMHLLQLQLIFKFKCSFLALFFRSALGRLV